MGLLYYEYPKGQRKFSIKGFKVTKTIKKKKIKKEQLFIQCYFLCYTIWNLH
jgi:hypothetical protein